MRKHNLTNYILATSELNSLNELKANLTLTNERPSGRLPQLSYFLEVFFDVYGCQMNEGDAEVVHSVLTGAGYERTDNVAEADVWLLVTCSIRESAEDKIWKKLRNIQHRKKAGIFLK